MKTNKCFLFFLGSILGLQSCKSTNSLDPDQFEAQAFKAGTCIVDVRTASEYAQGHLYRAINIDWQKDGFMDEINKKIDKTIRIAVYCRSGKRSAAASAALTEAGYDVINLKDGYISWTDAGKMTNTYQVESFSNGHEPVYITLIKHGSLEISYKGYSIQVDPVSGYGKNTDYSSEFPKADAILITHEHGDHLDINAINALSSDKTRIIMNAKSQQQTGIGETMSNGQRTLLDPVSIALQAVPAYNTTPGREQFHPKGNGNGYFLGLQDGLTIYIAGDTEDIPEMADLYNENNRYMVSFLPVNQPYTMTVQQCVKAANMIKPSVLIPYHFSQTDLSGLPGLLPDIKVLLRDMQ